MSILARRGGEQGVGRGDHSLVIVVAQALEETADPAERLPQEKIGCAEIERNRVSVALQRLQLRIPPAEHTGRSEKFHGCGRTPRHDRVSSVHHSGDPIPLYELITYNLLQALQILKSP